MRKLLFLSILFLMGISANAQRYDIITQDICWSTGSVDSSLTRYLLVSPLASTVKVLAHLNSAGQKVVPSGGTFSAGHCGCCGGTSSSSGGGDGTVVNANSGVSLDGDTIILGGTIKMNTVVNGMGTYGLDLTNLKYLTLSAQDSVNLITPDLISAAAKVGGVLQLNSATGRVEFTYYAFPLNVGANGQFMAWDEVGDSLKWTSPYITAIATDSSYRFSVNGSSVSEVLFKNFATIDLSAIGDRIHKFNSFDLGIVGVDSLYFSFIKRLSISQGGQRFFHQTGGGGGGGDYENLFIGYQSGQSFSKDSTGYANTVIGRRSGSNLNASASSGSSNTVMGYDAMRYNARGSFNTMFGTVAGGGVSGQSHTNASVFGYHAGRLNTGDNVSIFGSFAGENNTASGTTAFGYRSLRANTAGAKNSSFGYYSGDSNTGESNVFIGYEAAGSGVGSGGFNTIVGTESGRSLSSGSTNVFVGRRAGYLNSSGGNNTYIGNNSALNTGTIGSGNIVIGYGKELSSSGVNNELNIGDVFFGENINSSSGRIGINGRPNDESALDLSSNPNSMILPKGAYSQRPTSSPTGGMIRYDTDLEGISSYDPISTFWTSVSRIQLIDTVQAVAVLNQNKEYVVFDASDGDIDQSLPEPVNRWKWSFSCINCNDNTVSISTFPDRIMWYNGDTVSTVEVSAGQRLDLNSDGEFYFATRVASTANGISILDTDDNFVSDNVEGALQELVDYDTVIFVNNNDVLTWGTILDRHKNIYIVSQMNSSSTSDNDLVFPTPTTATLGNVITIFSRDLDNGFDDNSDTAISSSGTIRKGNTTISGYICAGGEVVEMQAVDIDGAGTIEWQLSPKWDGWTSTGIVNTASPTVYVERKNKYIFDAATQGPTTNILEVSDLEPGDEILILILGADGGNDCTLNLSSGDIIYDNLSGDATEVFTDSRLSLRGVWTGIDLQLW